MGSSGSKLVKKIFGPSSSNKDPRKKHNISVTHSGDNEHLYYETVVANVPSNVGPLVTHRHGSMFFDEDGELAHEFYVEVKEGRKSKMKRVYDNLRPQGIVELPIPRLHSDCPMVLYVL